MSGLDVPLAPFPATPPFIFEEPIIYLSSSCGRGPTHSGAAGGGAIQSSLSVAQMLIDGFPADPVITGKRGFQYTAASALDQRSGSFL